MTYSKYKFVKRWRKKTLKLLEQMYPEVSRKDIKKFLNKIIEERIKNPNCEIDNDYLNKNIKTTLLDVIDWIEATKPICAGFGVFYKNQHEVKNPLATMILKFLRSRKAFKSRLKDFVPGSYEYKTFDRKQLSEKINCNSIYGALGNIVSFLFNRYTAPSVTASGQSLISTTEQAFEMFMANNILFNSIDECMTYITNILNEEYEMDDNFLKDVSDEQLVAVLSTKFYNLKDSYIEILTNYISTLTQSQVNRIYYKNNIFEFSKHPEIISILVNIVRHTKEFKDPNETPESSKEYLELLWKYYKQFVLYNYSPINRVQRLKNDKRRCVITIDTDSNFLNLHPWVEFMRDNVINPDYKNDGRDKNELKFIAVNTMAYCITNMMKEVLGRYCKDAHIPEDFRHYVNIKNEFLMSRVVLANKKKKYISSIRLREGNEIYPEKTDIKGFEFIKSTATQETQERFMSILRKRILDPEVIDISVILQDLEEFEHEIIDSLKRGEKTYIIPKSVKELAAYTDGGLREQGVRAIIAWNYLYPDMTIELPAKVDIVKLLLDDERHLNRLKSSHPDIYAVVEKKILNNPDERISKKALPVIAIPRNVDKIPEWMLDYIDYDTISCDIMKKFYPLLNSLGISTISVSKKEYYSNIINF